MAENDEPRVSPIRVIEKPDDLDVIVEISTKPAPYPVGYKFFWMLADVYIVEKKFVKDYTNENYQVDTFDEGRKVILEVDVPSYIETHPERTKFLLQLLYYNRFIDEWERFKHDPLEKEKKSVRVTVPNPWIKDPPVGWGGNEPH